MFLCGENKMNISAFLQSRIEARDFPSAVYLVAEKGKIILQDALGLAVVEPEKIEAQIDTIYDLASLTKPLVTGLLCAKLIENDDNLSWVEQLIFRYFQIRIISFILTHNGWDLAAVSLNL